MNSPVTDYKALIREVPNFPNPGILFYDITTLLKDAQALRSIVDELADRYRDKEISKIIGIESRGFIFGSCVARILNCGFVPIRKPGKLPWTKRRYEYELEYGKDVLEIHNDAVGSEDRVLIVDDVLATGGTMAAAAALVADLGAQVTGIATVMELTFLDGRRKLTNGARFHTLLTY